MSQKIVPYERRPSVKKVSVIDAPSPQAGDIDVDAAERALMNNRGWCYVADGTACMECRQTCIEGIAVLRGTGRLHIPDGVRSFVELRELHGVWHFDLDDHDPDVQLVMAGLHSPQCIGDDLHAAKVIVAAMIRTGLLVRT